MCSLIIQDYNKFKEKLTFSTVKSKTILSEINFRYIITSSGDAIVMDYLRHCLETEEWLYGGNAIIRINDIKNYTLTAHLNYRTKEFYDSYDECVYYDISKELLKEIADASKVELLVTGHNVYEDFKSKTSYKIIVLIPFLAQALWDAIHNSSEYTQNINNALQYIENCKKYENWTNGRIAIVCALGAMFTFFGGGIWSLLISSWTPMIWFAVLLIIWLIRVSLLKSDIKAFEAKY